MTTEQERPLSQDPFDINWDEQILKDLNLSDSTSTGNSIDDSFKGTNYADMFPIIVEKTVDVVESKVVRLLLIELKHEPYFPEFVGILKRCVEGIAAIHSDQMEIEFTAVHHVDEPPTIFITVPIFRSPVSPRFLLDTYSVSSVSLQQTLLPVFNWLSGIMAARRHDQQYFMLQLTLWNPSRNAILQPQRPIRDGHDYYIRDLSVTIEKRTRMKVDIIENSYIEGNIKEIVSILEDFFPIEKRNGLEQYSLSTPDYQQPSIRQSFSRGTVSHIRNWLMVQNDYRLDHRCYGALQIFYIDLYNREVIPYFTV